MYRKISELLVFLTGLLVVGWIGVGYVVSNPLGAVVTAIIGAFYLAGAFELYRYRQATATLDAALQSPPDPGTDLGQWLARLHPGLRNAVRLRIEGERVALPAPSLTPYLVGLLVLLGMLGTLLGMMVTLRGTGLALESAGDLQAIRGSLAAPVKGLGFAFGTSIAGVAASAMLGLLSALVRHARQHSVQRLDGHIATGLRVHSQAHQREQAFALQQRQADALPALVEHLQALTRSIAEQSERAGERLLASQEAFHARTEASQAQLLASLEHTLKQGVTDSAQAVTVALQPLVETTMDGLARGNAALQAEIGRAVQQQLDGLTAGFAAAGTGAKQAWDAALLEQARANQALDQDLRRTLDGFNSGLEQHAGALLEGMAGRFASAATAMDAAWTQALAQQQADAAALAASNERALSAAVTGIAQHAQALVQESERSHAALQTTLAGQDAERLAAWNGTLTAIGAGLREDWRQAGEVVAQRQQAICDTLERTAADMSAQAQVHAGQTIDEISRLVDAAAQAPRAAAEVVAELRQALSDSMVRDTKMLEERTQLLGTLDTLLAAVNHASSEQRSAIDALVAGSAELLERVGGRFAEQVQAESGRLDGVAAQLTAGAVEVGSLGESLGQAMQLFGRSNEELATRLQSVEGALERSLLRSDEQLAYYVAQAREVIDLSMLAQRQIMEDLQRVGGAQADAGATPA